MNIFNIGRELNKSEMKIAYFARFIILAMAVLIFWVEIFRFVVSKDTWDYTCIGVGLAYFFSFFRYSHMLKKYNPLTTYHIKLFIFRCARYVSIPLLIYEWSWDCTTYALIFFFVLTIVCEITTVRKHLKIKQLKEQIKKLNEKK